jgi:hypothetical protein
MFLALNFPPGVWDNGTDYAGKGRYIAANLVRWISGVLRPVGPWIAKTASTVTGSARAMITWRINTAGTTYAAIGTHSKLYIMNRTGTLFDITPAGFTSGRADAVSGGGYGSGNYGAGYYGAPTSDSSTVQEASTWSLDNWGEYLVGCMTEDADIYEWQLNTGTPAAAVTNAPTASAILVTEEQFLLALGAASNLREIAWCDQADNTLWAAAPTNQAGSNVLQTNGRILCGKRVPGAHLIFTDVDVWRGVYQGPPLVYGYERIGSDCGAISRKACAVAGPVAYWMGLDGFWTYNGYVSELQSEVADYVFSSFNRAQASKVHAFHNSQFGEVWWFYPSASSTEIDRYALHNYREKHWSVGNLARLCAADRGIFQYPMMVNASGAIYEHEQSFVAGTYDSATVYATTGPIELGGGDRAHMVRQYIPDEATAGAVTATFTTRMYPNGTASTVGPKEAANPCPLRFVGRQTQVTYTGDGVSDWRVGTPRLDLVPVGMR